MSILRRKGKKVEYDEGTEEDVGTSSESGEYFEREGRQQTGESEKAYMDRLEKDNPDAQAYRKAHGQTSSEEEGGIFASGDKLTYEKTSPAKGSEEYMEQFRADRKAKKEQNRQEELERLKARTETQQSKTELAKLHKEEVEAGGGGIGGFVKRTASGVKRDVIEDKRKSKSKSSKTTSTNRRTILRTSPTRMGVSGVRGQHPSTSMRQLFSTGTPITGRGRTPISSSGVSPMRDLTIPRANPALQATMKPNMKPSLKSAPRPSFKMSKGISLGVPRVAGKKSSAKPSMPSFKMPKGLGLSTPRVGGNLKMGPSKTSILKNRDLMKSLGLATKAPKVSRKSKRPNTKRYNRATKSILRSYRI